MINAERPIDTGAWAQLRQRIQRQDWQSWVAGAVAGTSMAVTGHPFDTLKTRMQVDGAHRGVLACARATVQHEGVLALWKGLSPALLTCVTTSSIRLGVQSWANAAIARRLQSRDFESLGLATRVGTEAAGGAVAGLVLPTIFTPLEMVKCRRQTSTRAGARGPGLVRVMADVLRAEGLRGVYVGHSMTVLRATSGNAALFGPYVLAKDALARVAGEGSPAVRPAAGIIAGWCSCLVCFPVDAVKTRMQVAGAPGGSGHAGLVDLRGMWPHQALRQLWREGGMYHGVGPAMMRAVPVHILYMPVYDFVAARLRMWT